MTRLAKVLAACAFLACAQAIAAADDPALQRAVERGKLMYRFDRAAWVTSDDLVARLPKERGVEVGGWIVTPFLKRLHVDYFGKGQASDKVIYSADVEGESVSNAMIYPASAEPSLTPPALQMERALQTARAEMTRHSNWQPCANAPFNTIVLPPQRDGLIAVYFLTPQTVENSFPFGGHYEVDVSGGGQVTNARAFTNSCITMTKPAPGADGKLAMMFITHLLDPVPTEVHVFEQYYVGVPVVVGVPKPRSIWKVEDGRIEDVTAMMKQ